MSIRVPSLTSQVVDEARKVDWCRTELAELSRKLGITPIKGKSATLEDEEEALVASYLNCKELVSSRRQIKYFRFWKNLFLVQKVRRVHQLTSLNSHFRYWYEIWSLEYQLPPILQRKSMARAFEKIRRYLMRKRYFDNCTTRVRVSSCIEKKRKQLKYQAFYNILRAARVTKESRSLMAIHISRKKRINVFVENLKLEKLKLADSKEPAFISDSSGKAKVPRIDSRSVPKEDKSSSSNARGRQGKMMPRDAKDFYEEKRPNTSQPKVNSARRIPIVSTRPGLVEEDVIIVASPTRRNFSQNPSDYADVKRGGYESHSDSTESANLPPPAYSPRRESRDIAQNDTQLKEKNSPASTKSKGRNLEPEEKLLQYSRLQRQREFRKIAEGKLAIKKVLEAEKIM